MQTLYRLRANNFKPVRLGLGPKAAAGDGKPPSAGTRALTKATFLHSLNIHPAEMPRLRAKINELGLSQKDGLAVENALRVLDSLLGDSSARALFDHVAKFKSVKSSALLRIGEALTGIRKDLSMKVQDAVTQIKTDHAALIARVKKDRAATKRAKADVTNPAPQAALSAAPSTTLAAALNWAAETNHPQFQALSQVADSRGYSTTVASNLSRSFRIAALLTRFQVISTALHSTWEDDSARDGYWKWEIASQQWTWRAINSDNATRLSPLWPGSNIRRPTSTFAGQWQSGVQPYDNGEWVWDYHGTFQWVWIEFVNTDAPHPPPPLPNNADYSDADYDQIMADAHPGQSDDEGRAWYDNSDDWGGGAGPDKDTYVPDYLAETTTDDDDF